LLLAARANLLAAVLAFATVFVYLIIYTPMKLLTPASTLVGAVPARCRRSSAGPRRTAASEWAV
jgi:Polyprenyltransferase (cytochrome oxidase assembly factor)